MKTSKGIEYQYVFENKPSKPKCLIFDLNINHFKIVEHYVCRNIQT
jgi:hypothetical protein